MKNNDNIKFKKDNYYTAKFYNILTENIAKKTSTITLDNDIQKLNIEAIDELNILFKTEGFKLNTYKNKYRDEYYDFLKDMLPTLCLNQGEQLNNGLSKIGFDENVKRFFLDHSSIGDALDKLNSSTSTMPNIESGIKFLVYNISFYRCYTKISAFLEQIDSKNSKGKIIKIKILIDKMWRRIRAGKKIKFNNTSERYNELMNSVDGKNLLKTQKEMLSKNHYESYNASFLSFLIFVIHKINSNSENSNNQICLELYDLFSLIYIEKNLYRDEEEYLSAHYDKYAKSNPTGDNYRDYRIKNVKSIISYNKNADFLLSLKKYELSEKFTAMDLLGLLNQQL
tara:strand:+ start:1 stop:1020 length:1020 start_codon:yes stop_codon:yes gene_type:complete